MKVDLVALAAIVVFGLLLRTVIIKVRKEREQEKRLLREAGFFEVKPEKVFLDEVRALLRRASDKVVIRQALCCSRGDCDLYLFHPEPSETTTRTAVVRSSHLALPRFLLTPKVTIGGTFGALLNKLGEKLLSRQFEQVECLTLPGFGDKYFLYGENAAQIRQLFTATMLSGLTSLSHRYHVQGQGDLFIFSRQDPEGYKHPRRGGWITRENLQNLLDDGLTLFELFKEPSRAGVDSHVSL